jgi:hypothetical protein
MGLNRVDPAPRVSTFRIVTARWFAFFWFFIVFFDHLICVVHACDCKYNVRSTELRIFFLEVRRQTSCETRALPAQRQQALLPVEFHFTSRRFCFRAA